MCENEVIYGATTMRRGPRTELPALGPGRVRSLQRTLGEILFASQRRDHSDEVAEAVILGFKLEAALAARRLAGCRRQLAVPTLDDDHDRPSQGVAASMPGSISSIRQEGYPG